MYGLIVNMKRILLLQKQEAQNQDYDSQEKDRERLVDQGTRIFQQDQKADAERSAYHDEEKESVQFYGHVIGLYG